MFMERPADASAWADETEFTSISSAAGSPVRTLASLENGLASPGSDRVSVRSIGALVASSNYDGSSLKTSQQFLLAVDQS